MQRRRRSNEEGWLLSYADLITNLLIFFAVIASVSVISEAKLQQMAKAVTGEEVPESLEEIQKEIERRIKERKLEHVISTDLTDEGLELSLNSGVVFGSGRAEIGDEMVDVLGSMLDVLANVSRGYNYAVEGHTDDQPVTNGSQFKSNWELSTARAIEVRGRLEEIGVDRNHIRVEGYADTLPLPEEELVGLNQEERRARHRRVIVRVF